jgi:hypothetical protein
LRFSFAIFSPLSLFGHVAGTLMFSMLHFSAFHYFRFSCHFLSCRVPPLRHAAAPLLRCALH